MRVELTSIDGRVLVIESYRYDSGTVLGLPVTSLTIAFGKDIKVNAKLNSAQAKQLTAALVMAVQE